MPPTFIKRPFIALLFCFLFPSLAVLGQIAVSPGQTAVALARKLAGQGVTITNPSLQCFSLANGFFKAVNSNLGLDSGIVLTTGRAATSPGFYGVNGYSSGLANNDNGYPGDSTLTALAHQTTMDACTLEFDVTPVGDTISIGFVFSSEEYINAVCGPYNDAFGFFISGPGITGSRNMALVPGTNIPVTINSINNGIPGSAGNIVNCTSMGAGSPFTAYYNDNANGTTLTHRGLTKVLQAVYPVTQCAKYHLKLVIADAKNGKYDSGVFLEAGSLQSLNYRVQALASPVRDTFAPICVKGCLPATFRVKRTKSRPVPEVLKFITAGTAISGVDYAPVPDSVTLPANATTADIVINGLPTLPNGTKTLQLFILSPFSCAGASNIVDSASILIYDTIRLSAAPADTTVCGGDSVLLRVAGDDIYTYSWSPEAWLSNKGIKQPIAYPGQSTIYTVTASLPGISCPFKTAASSITVKLTPHIDLATDTVVCGNATFQLAPAVTPANNYYSYSWAGPGGFASSLLQPVLSGITAQGDGIYHLRVTLDTNGCSAKAAINIQVNIVDTPVVTSPTIICQNSMPGALNLAGGNIVWYDSSGTLLGANTPVLATDALASYHFFVARKVDNCESPKVPLDAEIRKCCDGTIYVPNAFTPNGDGRNDKFRPMASYGYFVKEMAVFNRWGQVVYSGNTGAWDGNFGATAADQGVYFYKVIFGCILGGTEERAGDVTLIR